MTRNSKRNKQVKYQPENFALVAQGARRIAMDPRVQQYALDTAGRLIENWMNKPKKNKHLKQISNKAYLQILDKRNSSLAPVAINTRARTRRAKVGSMKGGISINHREYIGDITGSTDFSATSYQVQPGLPQTFPWLSGIANNFEKYKIKNLKLEYVNVSATSERGRVTMAFDRDPLDEDPVSKVELFSYDGAVEGSVWSPLQLNVPNVGETFFTRDGSVTGTDLKTYDLGKLIIAASNTADSTSVIGELFLSYDVELTIPQPAKCPSVYVTANNTMTEPFGSAAVTNGAFPATFVDDTITFLSPGTYLVSMMLSQGSGLTSILRSGTATRSAQVLENTEGTKCSVIQSVRALAGQTLIMTGAGGSSTASYTWVTRCGGQLV